MNPCVFSPCRRYRYTLWRDWDMDLFSGCADDAANANRYVMFIGLNPSTADETQDDPTIRRCIDFAKRWGYGRLCMTNLFAFRATQPADMKMQRDPIGDENDRHLVESAKGAGLIIAAWGNHGSHLDRAATVIKLVQNLHALRVNADGSPQHPLYLPANTVPIPYKP